MKKIGLFLIIAIFLSVSGLLAQDPMQVAPKAYQKVFENDRVRVFHVTLKAGEKVGMHSHPAHFVYAIDDAKLKLTDSTGKSQTIELKEDQGGWIEPVTHEGENLGGDTELVVVEFKK